MTDQKSDTDNTPTTPKLDKPTTASTSATPNASPVTPTPAATPATTAKPASKSGRGLAVFALLVALGAIGGSGYLWYLWQQEQATQTARLDQEIKQAIAQRDPEFQGLKATIGELQALKNPIDQNENAISQLRTEFQALNEKLLSLTGGLQPLQNANELQKGETEIVKNEIKLLRESHEAYKTSTQQERQTLSAQIEEQQTRLAQLNERLQNLQLSHNGLVNQLESVKLIASQGGDTNVFPLAEVDYLLRLADTKLKLERNVDTARMALTTAQQQLAAIDEKGQGLTTVKTMLGETIATLRGVRLPDMSALAHKLFEMEKQIDTLPLKFDSGVADIKNRVKPSTTATMSEDTERPLWDRASEAVWDQFKDIVVIRRERSEAPPLIAREEEYFLRQNLRLELEAMRTALLGNSAQSFQDSYELARDWTEKYFDVADPKAAEFLAELQALQTVQFNPYIPDLTGLRQAFQEFIAQRQPIRVMQSVAPANAQPSSSPTASTEPSAETAESSAESTEAPAMSEETQP